MTTWTAPISWPTGLDVTETILNQQVRDNFLNLNERLTVVEGLEAIKTAILAIVPDTIAIDTSTGVKWLPIPSTVGGMNLIAVKAFVTTAGVTGATTIQVRNMTKYPANDSLTAAMSIASLATKSTGGTIDATHDDVSTDDMLKVYVTGQSTTKPYGLYVILEFQAP
jgi:hypothetical protein